MLKSALSMIRLNILIASLFATQLMAIQPADEVLERVKNELIYETEHGFFYIEAGAQVDLTGYHTDTSNGNAPGFFFPKKGEHFSASSRLTLTLDSYLGDHLYGFVKLRLDDGGHPGLGRAYGETGQFRWDELYLRASFYDGALQVQAGQFVPVLGNFLSRQDNWQMGLISYPLPYEQVTSVSDLTVVPSSAAFASRRDRPDFPQKVTWLPAYWAQLYTRGISVFGAQGAWDYGLNLTNRAPSSRGLVWNDNDWTNPSWMGSVGYRPSPSWRVGLTGTHGPYLQDSVEPLLPAGRDVGDFTQTNLGLDLTYEHRHLTVWAELIYTSFEVPNVGDDAVFYSYFIEGRYAFRPGWWLSGRWNHQLYEKVDGLEWDNEHMRIDLGVGHRLGRHTQIKLQYSYQNENTRVSLENTEHFFALEMSIRL